MLANLVGEDRGVIPRVGWKEEEEEGEEPEGGAIVFDDIAFELDDGTSDIG